jgi:hypothetical protein
MTVGGPGTHEAKGGIAVGAEVGHPDASFGRKLNGATVTSMAPYVAHATRSAVPPLQLVEHLDGQAALVGHLHELGPAHARRRDHGTLFHASGRALPTRTFVRH